MSPRVSLPGLLCPLLLMTWVWPASVKAEVETIRFLAHSTGYNLYSEGDLNDHLAAIDPGLQVGLIYYPTSPYPWDNYPYDYWNLWVHGDCDPAQQGRQCFEQLVENHDLIIFKHCYPGSDVLPDTGFPDVSSSRKSLENYKLQYRALRNLLDSRPDKMFIVWTVGPRHRNKVPAEGTAEGNAARATQFASWVLDGFLTEDGRSHPNIFVFDFRGLVSGEDNFLAYAFERDHDGTDSHPNTAANQYVAPIFAQFIVDAVARYENGGGNADPSFLSDPVVTATAGESYHYQPVVVDPDGDRVRFALEDPPTPDGFRIDEESGEVSWFPGPDQIGQHAVAIRAEDPGGGVAVQEYTLSVAPCGACPRRLPAHILDLLLGD